MSSVTSEQGQSLPDESAPLASAPGRRTASWAPWLVMGCYLAAAYALTWRLWADPGSRVVSGNPGDANLVAWFMRYSATAISHGRLPALVTTGLNAPQGISLMWNASMLLPGIVLAPVTLLAGPWTSLTLLLTLGFAGSAASLFWVLRWWGASIPAATAGGLIYGFSPALVATSMGHFQLQFAVLPPLIIHMLLRILTGRGSTGRGSAGRGSAGRGRAVRAGVGLGLLTAAQLFIGEEVLVDTAIAAVIVVVMLALNRPRAALEAIRGRGRTVATGLGAAGAVVLLTCGYALWEQFRGPLASHGSPWPVATFHTYLYAFVTPSGSLLFHTAASAAAATGYPEPQPEYLAYLGWPLLVLAIVAAVGCWRDPKVRLTALTFAVLELFSLGAASVHVHGFRYPGALLPWHWLQGLPVLADALPDRLCILADGAVAALLAFALDRARGPARAWGWRGYAAAAVLVLAILPLVPLPLPAARVSPAPAGWQQAFARLGLAANADVLVIPDLRNGMGWQAETGGPGSMVGGGAVIAPNRSGQATSYIYNRRPTAQYLEALYTGSPGGRPPSPAQLRADLAYWHLAAILAVTTPTSRLGRYLAATFGPPVIEAGDVLAWPHPALQATGRLAQLRREWTHVWPGHDRHHRRSGVSRLAPVRTAASRRLFGDLPG